MNTPVTNNVVIDELRQALAKSEHLRERQSVLLLGKERIIDKLEQQLAMLAQRHWGVSSEKHPGQGVLALFNEAELAATDEDADEDEQAQEPANKNNAPPKARRRRRVLPDHLERVRITYELDDAQRHSDCGQALVAIGEEITEQLGVLPSQQFVIQHVKIKYACPCKGCGVKTASMPPQPLPGSQASALLLAHTMVSKFHDGLPLYRQERMAARMGLDLPRSKLARWLIDGSALLQPLYNLMEDVFFSYDIAMSDDTGIQVLKEDGRSPHSRSALWIRRGGAPETPVVLVDYNRSKGAKAISPLLEEFHGYLVCDAAPTFNAIVAKNDLKLVLCNDHARRSTPRSAYRLGGESPPSKASPWHRVPSFEFMEVTT